MAPEWIDVSVPIYDGMVHWPGDPAIEITHPLHLHNGGKCTVSHLSLGAHTGTHMDAPNHFLKDTNGIDAMSPDLFIGEARVIEIPDRKEIGEKELREFQIKPGERILLKTSNSERCWKDSTFVPDFVALNVSGADYLAQIGIRTVGIDYLSIGNGEEGPAVHHSLLGKNICIIEGLNLSQVKEGTYEMLCLPIKIKNGDGAPARAFLRRIS